MLLSTHVHHDREEASSAVLEPKIFQSLLDAVASRQLVHDLVAQSLSLELIVPLINQGARDADVQVHQGGDYLRIHNAESALVLLYEFSKFGLGLRERFIRRSIELEKGNVHAVWEAF